MISESGRIRNSVFRFARKIRNKEEKLFYKSSFSEIKKTFLIEMIEQFLERTYNASDQIIDADAMEQGCATCGR